MNDDPADGIGASPQEYDFSSDLNISPVREDERSAPPVPPQPLPKSISEAVSKSLDALEKQDGMAAASGASAQPTYKSGPDPFREPINKLDTEWPFATPETIARHRDRQAPATAPAPANLPIEQEPVPPQARPSVPPLSAPPKPPAPATVSRPAPVPPPALRPTPPSAPAPAPAPFSTPAPASAQPSAQTPVPPQHPSILKNIRTYEGDVADALAHRTASKASIAIAESKKRGEGETIRNDASPAISGAEPDAPSHLGRNIAIALVSLALVGGGAFGGYYLYTQSPLGAPAPVPVAKPSPGLVPHDAQATLSVDGLAAASIVSKVRAEMAKPQAPDTLKEIVLTETKGGMTYRVPAPEIAKLASIPVPDIIYRTLKPEWMLAVYADPATGRNVPVVIVTTDLFQNAFAGMLAWEQSIPDDLRGFLPEATSTRSSARTRFQDKVVRNKDVRAFVTDAGDTAMAYSFIDNSTLVVAGSESAIASVVTRLENKAFLR